MYSREYGGAEVRQGKTEGSSGGSPSYSRPALAVLLGLALSLACWGQEQMALLDQLGAESSVARRQASAALIEKGPQVLGALFERMSEDDKTADLWTRLTAEAIVHRSTRPGAKAEQSATERALLQVVQGDHPLRRKRLAVRWLSLVGGRASVTALARLMGDASLREDARCALERIPDPSATHALVRAAMAAQEPEWKGALVKSLGARGDPNGRAAVLQALQDARPAVRAQAVAAAGRLPHLDTERALRRLWGQGRGADKEVIADALFHLAEGWLARGRKQQAAGLYRLFLGAASPLLRGGALYGLGQVGGHEAVMDLVAGLQDGDPAVRGVARDQLLRTPGMETTQTLIIALQHAAGQQALALIELLGERGDPAAVEVLLPMTQAGSEDCRQAAARALGQLRAPEAAAALLEMVKAHGGEVEQEAATALVRLPGDEVTRAIVRTLPDSSLEDRPVLLRVLGQRGDRIALLPVLEAARAGEEEVRVAALWAAGQLGDPAAAPVLAAAMEEDSPSLRNAAARATVGVSAGLQKAGQTQQAIELALLAAKSTSDGGILRQLADRLRALGATEHLAEMAEREGYIVHWWVIGPFGDRGALRERDIIDPKQAVVLTQAISVGNDTYLWKYVRAEDPNGRIDLEQAVARRDDSGAYLYAQVESPREQEALLEIGSDDDFVCWVNGQEVSRFVGDRGWVPDQDAVRVRLRPGANHFLLKVLNGGGQWAASVRIATPDGDPLVTPQKHP